LGGRIGIYLIILRFYRHNNQIWQLFDYLLMLAALFDIMNCPYSDMNNIVAYLSTKDFPRPVWLIHCRIIAGYYSHQKTRCMAIVLA